MTRRAPRIAIFVDRAVVVVSDTVRSNGVSTICAECFCYNLSKPLSQVNARVPAALFVARAGARFVDGYCTHGQHEDCASGEAGGNHVYVSFWR